MASGGGDADNIDDKNDRKVRKYVSLKNWRKKSKSLFKSGHSNLGVPKQVSEPVQREILRYDELEQSFIVRSTNASDVKISMPDSMGVEGNAIGLRPFTAVSIEPDECSEIIDNHEDPFYDIIEGNILVEKSRLCQLINTAYREHSDTGCTHFEFDLVKFKPWGNFCQTQAICKNCPYASKHVKLYEEIVSNTPGRRPATGNVRLQVVLQDMPIGNVNAQLILAALGVRAGSLSGMQNMSYKVSDVTVCVNNEDMNNWRNYIKQVQMKRGVTNPNHISAGYDVRYHGVFKKSGTTPGYGCTQATATLVENVTDHKKVIGTAFVNKYCPKGTRLNVRGEMAVMCGGPNSHEGCTANLPRWQQIQEGSLAETIAEDIGDNSDVAVVTLVSDSDGKGIDGFTRENNRSGLTLPDIKWQKDLTHNSTNQRRQLNGHKFTRCAFGPKQNGLEWNCEERKECRKALAHDVPYRCSLMLRDMLKYYHYDIQKMKKKLLPIVTYLLKCYNGDHSKCDNTRLGKQLLRCSKSKRWFETSPHLSGQRMTKLNMKISDEQFIKKIIDMKLGVANVDFFSDLETSSKNEAVNRAIKHSLPSNITFARVGIGRNHSAILKCNNGILRSTSMKCAALKCTLPAVTKSILKKYVVRSQKAKLYKTNSKARREFLKRNQIDNYYRQNRLQKCNPEEYRKFQLDEAIGNKLDAFNSLDNVTSNSLDDIESVLSTCLKNTVNVNHCLQNEEERDAHARRKAALSKRRKSKAAKKRCAKQNAARKINRKELCEHSYGSL